MKFPFDRFPKIWILCMAIALSPGQVAVAAPAGSAYQETLPHQKADNRISFYLPPQIESVALQVLSPRTGQWKTLSVKRAPRAGSSNFKVPGRWKDKQLRVLASYNSDSARRTAIPFTANTDSRDITFLTTAGARLFSVEAKIPGSDSWTRVSTVAATVQPQTVRVPLPASLPTDAELRVVAVAGSPRPFTGLNAPLTSKILSGPTVFAAIEEVVSGGAMSVISDSPLLRDSMVGTAVVAEESDIWKIRGHRIYFFNQLRGLQIIDAANRAAPEIAATFSLPAVGEDLYLLGGDASVAGSVVLLTRLPWQSNQSDATRIISIPLNGDQPAEPSTLDVPGYLVESRLVGQMLHIVSSSWSDQSGHWAPTTWVTTFDLGQDGAIIQTSQQRFPLSASYVGSTAKYLWIASTSDGDWSKSNIAAFPFALNGSLGSPLRTKLGGKVQDKFKVGDTADGLAVVVQNWLTPEGNWQQVTTVETYTETGTGALSLQAKLELIRGESLFATRFDASRLYAVTFLQKDPLWIVDLADPAKPSITGHLEVPGWSSFIQPMGDTLIAVGREDGRVQVSLFDVADPAKPSLAQRVTLGDSYSWSEAEWNEKAVKIIAEAGMILIPIVEWNSGNAANKVSILDFDPVARTLTARGTIAHDFSPRRATLLEEDTIASVSNRELILVDAADRNAPKVTAEVALAFGVDRVLVKNDTALQIENGGRAWFGSPHQAVLRVAPASNPEDVSLEIDLPCENVAAASIFGDRLVLVESPSSFPVFYAMNVRSTSQPVSSSPAVSVWSLADEKNPVLIGRSPLDLVMGSETELLAAGDGRIVITSRDNSWGGWYRPMVMRASGIADDARIAPWFGWGNQSLRVAVADISGEAPSILGGWQLSGGDYSGISEVHSAGDLLVFSYDRTVEVVSTGNPAPLETITVDGLTSVSLPPVVADGWTRQQTRSWLQILDLADPLTPMPWAPVQIPGPLVGVSWLQRSGGVIFSKSGDGQHIAALGFDGENASIVAEVDLGTDQNAFALSENKLYVAAEQGVDEWEFIESSSRWSKGAGWEFSTGPSVDSLHVLNGAILARSQGKVWILSEDGSVVAREILAQADINHAALWSGGFLLPSGEYGSALVPR